MKNKVKKTLKTVAAGVFTGLINGAFGAGGGMVAVPVLKKMGFDQKSAQENAVAVILPITVISAAVYLIKDYVSINDSLIYLPAGLVGALIGTYIIKKISPLYLKCAFGGFMIYAGIRTVLK